MARRAESTSGTSGSTGKRSSKGASKSNGTSGWINPALRTNPTNTGKGPVNPNSAAWAPLAPVRGVPNPRSQSRSTQNQQFFSDPGGSFGGGPQVAPAAISEEDYLAGDSGYQTQLSALKSALERYLADSDFQRTTYTTDYGKSLRDLGYDEGTKAWNWNDKLTASGRGYQNQLDDFASRGMLQSQGYADAYQELQRMLGQQYDALSGAKTTFMTDLDNQIANYKAENTASQQAARAEALQRRAAQYGL